MVLVDLTRSKVSDAIVTIIAWLVIWVGFYVIRDGHSFFDHDSVYGIPAKIAEIVLIFFLRADRK